MGARPLEFMCCAKCGFLFIRLTGRAKKGWTHHDGTYQVDTRQPNWCTCRAREQVRREIHAAILSAEQIGGRSAAQSLLDQARGVSADRNPDRLLVPRKRFARFSGIDRGVYGTHADRIIMDDPLASSSPTSTDEQRSKIIEWFTATLSRTGGV